MVRRNSNKLTAQALSLKELFSSSERFSIPKYQRTYEWDDSNVKELLTDMLDENLTEEQPYFIGPIMVTSRSRSVLDIVDGQQRLMTNYLFLGRLACFYKKFIDKNFTDENDEAHQSRLEKLKDLIHILIPPGIRGQQTRPKIIPSALDADEFNITTSEFFEESLDFIDEIDDIRELFCIPNDLPDYGKLLDNNYSIKEFLENFLGIKEEEITNYDDALCSELDKKFDFLMTYPDRVEVIEITLANYQDPIQIFNSLNSEGMELSDFDLVRSTFFDFFDESTNEKDENDFYVHTWLKFETNFFKEFNEKFPKATPRTRKKHKDGFLKNYLILKNRTIANKNIHEEMRKLCAENIEYNEGSIKAGLKSTVEDMMRFSVPYNTIATGFLPKEHQEFLEKKQKENRFNKARKRFLESVQSIHLYKPQSACNAYLMRLIESGFSINDDGSESYVRLQSIKRSLDIFESYTIRRHFMHADASPKNLFEPLARHERFWDCEVFAEILKDNKAQRPFFTNKNMVDFLNNQDSPVSDNGIKSKKYFLYEYEKEVRGPNVDVLDIDDLEIEHICPQSFEENWSDVIKNNDDAKWIQTIGNMTLISSSMNKKLSNLKFLNKLDVYKNPLNKTESPRRITKNKKVWGVADIAENRNNMKLFLFKRWKDLEEIL